MGDKYLHQVVVVGEGGERGLLMIKQGFKQQGAGATITIVLALNLSLPRASKQTNG